MVLLPVVRYGDLKFDRFSEKHKFFLDYLLEKILMQHKTIKGHIYFTNDEVFR